MKNEKEKKGGEESKPEGHKDHKGKKLHLHQIRSVQARDGSVVHHHTYKDHPDHPYTHPEREAAATSENPEEAGQHVAEQFGMNEGAEQAQAEPMEGAGAQPGGAETQEV